MARLLVFLTPLNDKVKPLAWAAQILSWCGRFNRVSAQLQGYAGIEVAESHGSCDIFPIMRFKSLISIGTVVLVAGCGAPKLASTAGNNSPSSGQILGSSELDIKVLEKCKNATVLIGNFQGGEFQGSGSGFVAGDGKTIYTNKHVVTGTDDTVDDCKLVFFPGTSHSRVVNVKASQITVYQDAKREDKDYFKHDVAQIRIEAQVSDPLDTGDLSAVRETQDTWALGFPNGLNIRTDTAELPSVTVHSLKVERIERKEDKTVVLQFGGSPTYGNSGGPVVNSKGDVIGIIQALGDSRSSIIYGVPIWVAREIGSAQKAKDDFLMPMTNDKSGSKAPSKARDIGQYITSSGTSLLANLNLAPSDLYGFSAKALTILRNEPFARRGYRFSRSELREAFSNFSWYRPRTSDLSAIESDFNSRERHNVTLISDYQKANGLEW